MANLQERAAEVEHVAKERDRYADQMRRLQADAAQQAKTVQQLEAQVRQASSVPTSKVRPGCLSLAEERDVCR